VKYRIDTIELGGSFKMLVANKWRSSHLYVPPVGARGFLTAR
jgi:hypothetical protein